MQVFAFKNTSLISGGSAAGSGSAKTSGSASSDNDEGK